MSNKENTTSINIEGQIQLSSNSKILPKSAGEAKGIFIYDHQHGDFTNINEQELGDASFVVSRADNDDLIDAISKEINDYKSSHSDSTLRLGIAVSYTGHFNLTSFKNDHSPTNLIEHYVKVFNNNKKWHFRPVMHLSEFHLQNETIQGFEYNLNEQLNYLKTETNYYPIIHTSFEIAKKYLTDPVFAKFPLWLTDVNKYEIENSPGAWKGQHWHFLETNRYLESEIIMEKNKAVKEVIIYGTNEFHGTKKELDYFTDGKTRETTGNRRIFKIE